MNAGYLCVELRSVGLRYPASLKGVPPGCYCGHIKHAWGSSIYGHSSEKDKRNYVYLLRRSWDEACSLDPRTLSATMLTIGEGRGSGRAQSRRASIVAMHAAEAKGEDFAGK